MTLIVLSAKPILGQSIYTSESKKRRLPLAVASDEHVVRRVQHATFFE